MAKSNLNKALNLFGKTVTRASQQLLAQRKHNAGGKLSKSIKHALTKIGMNFSMEDYGVLRDRGVQGSKERILKGWNKSIFLPRGAGYAKDRKGPPPASIRTWIGQKNITYTPGLEYKIARSIKRKGITPSLFFSDAFNKFFKKLPAKLELAVAQDIAAGIKKKNNGNN